MILYEIALLQACKILGWRFRLIINNTNHPTTDGSNAYVTKNFSFPIVPSTQDLLIIAERLARTLAISFADIPSLEPIDNDVDHVLQYEISETILIGIASIFQIGLVVAYAASLGMCFQLAYEIIGCAIYIGFSIAQISIGWCLYNEVCKQREYIRELVESDEYEQSMEAFNELCDTSSSFHDTTPFKPDWNIAAFQVLRKFLKLFAKHICGFDVKGIKYLLKTSTWVKPFTFLTYAIYSIDIIVHYIIDYIYLKQIFPNDIILIEELYQKLTA